MMNPYNGREILKRELLLAKVVAGKSKSPAYQLFLPTGNISLTSFAAESGANGAGLATAEEQHRQLPLHYSQLQSILPMAR